METEVFIHYRTVDTVDQDIHGYLVQLKTFQAVKDLGPHHYLASLQLINEFSSSGMCRLLFNAQLKEGSSDNDGHSNWMKCTGSESK